MRQLTNCSILFFTLYKISKLNLNNSFNHCIVLVTKFFSKNFDNYFEIKVKLQENHKFRDNIIKIKILGSNHTK